MPTKTKGLAHLYDSARWRRLRSYQLQTHPLCAFCLQQGKAEPATVADHIEPHHDDVNKFWLGKLQSLCRQCHNASKQQVETRGYYSGCDITGAPLDPRHPFYERERRSGS